MLYHMYQAAHQHSDSSSTDERHDAVIVEMDDFMEVCT